MLILRMEKFNSPPCQLIIHIDKAKASRATIATDKSHLLSQVCNAPHASSATDPERLMHHLPPAHGEPLARAVANCLALTFRLRCAKLERTSAFLFQNHISGLIDDRCYFNDEKQSRAIMKNARL
ncbi:MAG: hypothetical protein AAFZ15_09595 [Bacteroidota bacterium]